MTSSRSVARRLERADDRGLVLVIAAITLTALLTMSALAVDLGGVYNERRQDQSAADTAALAAAQDLPDLSAAVTSAKRVASSTLGESITDAEWDSCTDPARYPVPPGYARRTGASCIAFNGARRRVLVRIPVRQYDAAFAGIVGISSFDHSAFAVAGLENEGFGGVLPFALAAGSSIFTCVERGGGNVAANGSECRQTSAQPGNFGALDFSWFGDEALGTTTDCATRQQRQLARFPNNVAVGADHDIETIATGQRRVDTAQCQSADGVAPNSAGGNNGSSFDRLVGQGLYSGGTYSDGRGPRLTRLGTVPGTPGWMTAETTVAGAELDDIPLWQYLPTDPTPGWAVPRSCWRDQFEAAEDPEAAGSPLPSGVAGHLASFDTLRDRVLRLTVRCITHYQGQWWDDGATLGPSPGDPPCTRVANPTGRADCSASAASVASFTDPLFSRDSDSAESPNLYDIQYSPRFGYVPETTDPRGNSVPADIVTFRATFLQRLYGACSNKGSSCGLLFDPGVGYRLDDPPANLHGATDAVGVFVLPSGSLPNGLADENAPYELNANRFVELVR